MSDHCAAPSRLRPHVSLRHIAARLWHALQVGASRQTLARLEPHLLRDIGLSPDQARQEARRAPWDAPATWRSPD